MYHLSNRQRKEARNGKTLSIVLPAPPDEPQDWLAWARASLDCAAYLVAAEPMTLPVDVTYCVGGGLAEDLGRIVRRDDAWPLDRIVLMVEVVVCSVAGQQRERGRYPDQWPGSWTPD